MDCILNNYCLVIISFFLFIGNVGKKQINLVIAICNVD